MAKRDRKHRFIGDENPRLSDSQRDKLTGLMNRTCFDDRLRRSLGLGRQKQRHRAAVLLLDLDRFKVINNSLGHQVGDQLLVETARRLETCVRRSDALARLGADEFVILADGIAHEREVIHIADRIRRVLSNPISLLEREVFTSASIGIVFTSSSYEEPEEVVRDADTAMNRAKHQGPARFEIFEPPMRAQANARLEGENDLRWALRRKEFRLQYQPIWSLEHDRIVGFEALIRWHHPHRGIVPPTEFLSAASETGVMIELGQWVLQEACSQMRKWKDLYDQFEPMTISVNIVCEQLLRSAFPAELRMLLAKTNLSADKLKLEVTESARLERSSSVAGTISDLEVLGVKLQIDDFGTGYSSLDYLNWVSCEALKIDRTFIARMLDETAAAEIVRMVIRLAHSLNLVVIAEGVETEAQLRVLRELDCDCAQGYFFTAALNPEDVPDFVSTGYPFRKNSFPQIALAPPHSKSGGQTCERTI